MSHGTHINESCHAYERVISQVASVKEAAGKADAAHRNSQAQDSSFFADLTSPPVTLNIMSVFMSVMLLVGTAGMVTHSKMDSEDAETVDAKPPGLSLSLLLALALGCVLALLRALALCPVLYCTLYTSCMPH